MSRRYARREATLGLMLFLSLAGGCVSGEAATGMAADGPLGLGLVSPSRDEFGLSGGIEDAENRFRSAVQIEIGSGLCSGVLIARRLVLTAAHCFCWPSGPSVRSMDKTACKKNVVVESVLYRSREGVEPWVDRTGGTVVVHEGFRSELDVAGGRLFVKSKVADLAVIYLEKELANTSWDNKLREAEVLLNDEVTVVGYGAVADEPALKGIRRFGSNVVAELRLSNDRKGREIRFRFPGAHTHRGDSGGPCFLEEKGTRYLVGINGGYVSQGATESWFTSTSSYRDWIAKQIEEAKKRETS
ncbi:trypsin-like serine protease [Hyalangium minutum]|uniref:trypsin-like serine protease n=1 Tax=Hyalangium minutum TaxID=394096 RepID=UPI000A04496D|nr:trypsin-like serine protease [Hyalangium minutum]